MIKVALTGSTGLIGSRFVELLKDNFAIIPLTHDFIDITQTDQVDKKLKSFDFDYLIHLAAYTNVDKAEKEWNVARDINVNGTKNLFDFCQNFKKKLIFISTDFVFDGQNPPYDENSQPNPISNYGKSKYLGEQIVKNNSMIVRLSYPYGYPSTKKTDFVQTIKTLLKKRKQILMINDSLITPTFTDDVVFGLKYLINNYSPEIFHLVGNQSLSPLDAGQLIVKTFKLDSSFIKPVTYGEYFKNRAKRPRYSKIISIKNSFLKMKTFEEGLRELFF